MGEARPGTAAFGDLLIERRRRRDALEAHIAELSAPRRMTTVARLRFGLGIDDRAWRARYSELLAAVEEAERAVFFALGVGETASGDRTHAAE